MSHKEQLEYLNLEHNPVWSLVPQEEEEKELYMNCLFYSLYLSKSTLKQLIFDFEVEKLEEIIDEAYYSINPFDIDEEGILLQEKIATKMDAVEQQCDLVIQKFEEKINELKEIDVVNEVGIRNIKAFQE